MPARLNRRRYREVIAMLKEIISDKKAPAARRLRAGETLLEVYARHDRTEAQKEARKRAGKAAEGDIQPDTVPEASEQPQGLHETIDAFLERIRGSKKDEAASNDDDE
jgi:hypothetical protein